MNNNSIINRGSLQSWLLIASFYLFQYLLRIMPISMRDSWQTDFNMTATDLGIIGASFLYTYSLIQIPIGYAIDRFGIWWITFISLALCTSGVFLCVQADNIELLIISRLLIGLGSASPFICAMKVIYNQFPISRQSFYSGLTLALAMIGVVLFNFILQDIVTAYGWREASYFLLFIGIMLMVSFYNTKRITSAACNYRSKYSPSKIVHILRTKEVWGYIIITICLYIPLPVFADIWSGAILNQRYDFSPNIISQISICCYIGCIIGSLILPIIRNERYTLIISLITAIIFMLIAIYVELSIILLYTIFFLIGFCAGSVIVAFRSVEKYVDSNALGLAFGITNTCAMLGLGAINYLIGIVVDYLWNGDLTILGEKLYANTNYQYAITAVILPVISLGIILSLIKWDRKGQK